MDYISSDNKIILFRIYKLYELKSYYLEHINDIFSACFNQDNIEMDEGGIIKYIALSSTETYSDFNTDNYIANITSFCTVHVYDDKLEIYNVCSTALGKSIGSAKMLLQEMINLSGGKQIMLSLEFENMYWDRALSVYTSLGFVDPYPRYEQKDVILTRQQNFYSTDSARNSANSFRVEYFDRNGLSLYKFKFFSRDILDFADFMLAREKEYTGHFYIDSDSKITQIRNMYSGVLIENMFNAPAFCSTPNVGLLHFHTHPVYTTFQNRLVINQPSTGDINYMLGDCIQNNFRMYIFDLEGLYALSYSPMTTKLFCKHPELIEDYSYAINMLYEEHTRSIYNDEMNLVNRFGNDVDIQHIRKILINGYIDSINQMTWGKIAIDNKVNNFIRQNNIDVLGWHIFNLSYYSYEFMRSKSQFEDTIVLPKGCFSDRNIGGTENHIPIGMPDYYKAVILKTEESERERDNYCKSKGIEFRREYLLMTDNLQNKYKPIFEDLVEMCLPFYAKNYSELLLLATPQNVGDILQYISMGYGYDDIIKILTDQSVSTNIFEEVENRIVELSQNPDAVDLVNAIRQ